MEKDTKEISPLEWTNALENFHCIMITKPIVVEKKEEIYRDEGLSPDQSTNTIYAVVNSSFITTKKVFI